MPKRGQKAKKGQATKDKSQEQEVFMVIGDPDKLHPDKVDKAKNARSSRARSAPKVYRDEDYESPRKSSSKTVYVDCIYFV